jgi:thymidylate kinase
VLTIVLVGADGAGKSSVSARLAADLPVPVRRMYLGSNPEAQTHPLPTSRAVRWIRDRDGRVQRTGGPPSLPAAVIGPPTDRHLGRRARSAVRAAARTANTIAEESYQQAIVRWHRRRGRIVICDRHPVADQFAHDLARRAGQRTSRRVHGAFLRRFVPPPDLVIVLDADPQVLHDRKGEGTLAELASRRDEYLRYARTVERAVLVDATQPLDAVVATVVAAVLDVDPPAERTRPPAPAEAAS